MRCSNCGTKNPKKYKFCKECGEELVAKPAAASPQPTVVVIQEEKRRGVPALIWILAGMILIVLLCGLLVWLDFVDVPDQIRVILPDPIGDLVDAVDDARPPGAPDLPGGVAQDEPDQQWQPPQVSFPGGTSSEACTEDINFSIGGNQFDATVPFSRDAIGRFRSVDPFESDDYDLYLTQGGETQGPIPCATRPYDDWYEIYTEEYIQFDGNEWMTLVFKPRGEDCVVGRQQLSVTCDSGSLYRDGWPYNNGCCTHGCWCEQGGQMGCWQTCAPQCAE
jgi:hypothetical protein